MAEETHQSPLAFAYAKALLELANEAKTTEEIGKELDDLHQIVLANPVFGVILADPAIGHDERGKLLAKIFQGRISKLVYNFICLLNEKGRLKLLSSIAMAYDDLLDEQYGKIEVDVTVANKLSDQELEDVRQKVGAALKRDAVVHQYIDESIIGGLILRMNDQLIDGSVRTQLDKMRRQLLSSRPN